MSIESVLWTVFSRLCFYINESCFYLLYCNVYTLDTLRKKFCFCRIQVLFAPTLAGNVASGRDLKSLTETAKPAMSIANSLPACDWSVVNIKPSDWSRDHLEGVIEARDPVVPHNRRAHPELEYEAHREH